MSHEIDEHRTAEPHSTRFRFDPSLSWGDLAVALSLALSGILAFAQLSNRVSVVEVKLVETQGRVQQVSGELNSHKIDSQNSNVLIRQEVRDSLREVNTKLDRLIERELDRNTIR